MLLSERRREGLLGGWEGGSENKGKREGASVAKRCLQKDKKRESGEFLKAEPTGSRD